jgi:hypothetical protein
MRHRAIVEIGDQPRLLPGHVGLEVGIDPVEDPPDDVRSLIDREARHAVGHLVDPLDGGPQFLMLMIDERPNGLSAFRDRTHVAALQLMPSQQR